MESFLVWCRGFASALNLRESLGGFHLFDWFFLLFLFFGIIYGARKGFLRTTVELLEFVFILLFVLSNYEWLGFELQRWFSKLLPALAAVPIAYFLIFAVVWTAVMVVDLTFHKWIQAKTVAPLRVLGGGILGVVFFFLIFSMVCKGLSLLPVPAVSRLFDSENTRFGTLASVAAPELDHFLMRKLGILVNSK